MVKRLPCPEGRIFVIVPSPSIIPVNMYMSGARGSDFDHYPMLKSINAYKTKKVYGSRFTVDQNIKP